MLFFGTNKPGKCKHVWFDILSDKIIGKWYRVFRRCMVLFLNDQDGPDAHLGGEGVTIEVDESSFAKKAKYGRGKHRKNRWVLGIKERDPRGTQLGRERYFAVPNRNRQTLLSIILKHVKPGTTIMTDGWRAYQALDRHKNWKHQIVNHARCFREVGPGNEHVCEKKIC